MGISYYSALGQQVVKAGKANLGVQEVPAGSNRGKYVDIYNTFVGAPLGSYWCASFLCYRVYDAAKTLKVTPLWIKSASVQAIFLWAKKNNLVSDIPVAGMAFLEWFQSKRRYAHCGIITEVIPLPGNKFAFRTVEGNSNSNGSRNGQEVASNIRRWGSGYKAIVIKTR